MEALIYGLLAAALDVAVGLHRLRDILDGELLNSDSYMRLVRLEAILAAHKPLDVVARDGSGMGTVLHWSHLLDSILLVLAAPLTPWLGEHEALRWAGVILGPLGTGFLGAALAWAAAPLTDREWRWTAPVFGVFALPIIGYAMPGVIHHHILLALSGVMCAGWASRAGSQGARAGWHLGAWGCFGLWLSPETMMVTLMAFGAVGLGWLTEPREPRWGAALAAGTTMLAVLTALALSADPEVGAPFAMVVDRLSVAWLVLAVLGACAGWWFLLLDQFPWSVRSRGLLGAMGAVVAAGIWLALFPSVLGGPEGVVNGAHAHAFDGISEMQPITSFQDVMLYLLDGILAAVVAVVLAVRRRSWLFAYAAACVLVLLLTAVLHRRFATYAACAGAITVPLAVTLIQTSLSTRPPLWASAARLSLLLFLLLAPLATYVIVHRAEATKPGETDTCSIRHAVGMLRPFAGQIVLADVNDTPELLYRTPLLTVGSLYHRDEAGYLRLRTAWQASALDSVPAAVTATGATLVLFCDRAKRSFMVAGLPTDTLWDRLRRQQPPLWLQQVAVDPVAGLRLFRILPTHP